MTPLSAWSLLAGRVPSGLLAAVIVVVILVLRHLIIDFFSRH